MAEWSARRSGSSIAAGWVFTTTVERGALHTCYQSTLYPRVRSQSSEHRGAARFKERKYYFTGWISARIRAAHLCNSRKREGIMLHCGPWRARLHGPGRITSKARNRVTRGHGWYGINYRYIKPLQNYKMSFKIISASKRFFQHHNYRMIRLVSRWVNGKESGSTERDDLSRRAYSFSNNIQPYFYISLQMHRLYATLNINMKHALRPDGWSSATSVLQDGSKTLRAAHWGDTDFCYGRDRPLMLFETAQWLCLKSLWFLVYEN